MSLKNKKCFWGLIFFSFLFSFLIVSSQPVAAAKKEFKVGMEAGYPPFNWTQVDDSGGAVKIEGSKQYANGYDVQVAKIIAQKLDRKLVIVKTVWDGLAPALTSGKIDAIIAGMSPTAERRKTVDFSEPYLVSKPIMIVRKNSPYASATSIQDFKGAKITSQLSTFLYDLIPQINGVKQETAMNDFSAMRTALQSGVIDGYVAQEPEGISVENAIPSLKMIKFADGKGFKSESADDASAVGLRKNSPDLQTINQILAGISHSKREEMMTWAVKNQPQTSEKKVNWFLNIFEKYGTLLWNGTLTTLWISLLGTIIGFLIGLLVGIVRTVPLAKSKGKRIGQKIINFLFRVYIEVFRGTPMMVQAAIFYYGLAQAFQIDVNKLAAALLIVSINTGAYMSEIMRGGIESVDPGQREGALALGMSHFQMMKKVILPQAIRNSLPAVGNEFVINIKDTSVLSIISVTELFFNGQTIAGQTYQFFQSFFVICLIYLFLTFTVTQILKFFERKMAGPNTYNLMANQIQV
ncbi:ABC transporter permease subunit [Xylocopilactobacillus apicola]|uniref:Amino acid ABC transporter substrate-binding protein n=1 Tax=Xylocopilactobacillus apicola TaxID=2932184 RepID=A0AAU9D8G2_9LACO|nr:ABC transporter permease subunit [Xylocopilactobacillus apicola]BDR58676.1 amino acid ABC transporter substrate-binding protein [Xylocopilactobacillus apicola]